MGGRCGLVVSEKLWLLGAFGGLTGRSPGALWALTGRSLAAHWPLTGRSSGAHGPLVPTTTTWPEEISCCEVGRGAIMKLCFAAEGSEKCAETATPIVRKL